jgi:hypothetical protein
MYFKDDERDPFEGFGEPEPAPEIDFEAELEEAALAARVEEEAPHASTKVKTGFSWAAFMGGLMAFVWVGGAIGGPVSFYGVDALMRLDPAMQAGMIALAFGPALLFWVAASAAGEALKARKLAAELTRLAQSARAPFEANEADAQRMGAAVRGEIEAIHEAVAAALDRMAELEHSAKRNAMIVAETADLSRDGTEALTHALKRERDALAEINSDLRGQTEAVAGSIGRQVRLMREASKIVKSEMAAAEDALQAHLAAFAQSASMIGERTSAFHHAADEAASAADSLNGSMGEMLKGLSEATKLSESARKSSEQAVHAAHETAGALRETTRSAVFEAKRAAELIRAETRAIQETAAETLAKLKEAASAARITAERPMPAAATQRRPSPTREPISDLHAAAQAARKDRRPDSTERRGFNFGSWGNAKATQAELPAPANEQDDLIDFTSSPQRDPDMALKDHALDLVADAGVDLEGVLGAGDLQRIARLSRDGAGARRRAVSDAAPLAVTRIARYVDRNDKAHLVANEFRRRPDLAQSDKSGEGSDLVRAYLLIDAALA